MRLSLISDSVPSHSYFKMSSRLFKFAFFLLFTRRNVSFILQGNGVLLCDDNTKFEGEFVGECLLSGKVCLFNGM